MATFEGNIEASLPDLHSIAGSNVDAQRAAKALDQASTVIESISGVIFDAEYRELPVTKGDALWIKRAVVFQAVWLLEQGDSLSRVGASSLSQDGLSVSAPDELTFVLAPMAKRALGNCSWNGNKTTRIGGYSPSRVTDFSIDDSGPWTPAGGLL